MTEERRKLIDRFQGWLNTNPRKQIIAAECANIAEKYADEKLRLHNVSQQRKLLLAYRLMLDFDIKHEDIEESVNYFLKHKERYL